MEKKIQPESVMKVYAHIIATKSEIDNMFNNLIEILDKEGFQDLALEGLRNKMAEEKGENNGKQQN